MAAIGSSKKLQRFLHNQLLSLPSLSFSQINLLPTHQYLPAIIAQCRPHYTHITVLDCHFCILNGVSVTSLCNCLINLESLKIVDCGMSEFDHSTQWPKCLRCVDFSRNQLTQCPQGLASLSYLTTLNLSGNLIRELDPSLLRLPLLEKLHLLHNPVQNVPKHICRDGISKMREYFKTVILPLPQQDIDTNFIHKAQSISRKISNSNMPVHVERCQDFRRYLLRQQGSFDSGYESSQRCRSTSGSSIDMSDSDTLAINSVQSWPSFANYQLPDGYAPAAETNLCQVYLPGGCKERVRVELVKDISLYPQVQSNELLITPVVHITPHGLKFSVEEPAIVILPHCTKPSSCNGHEVTTQKLYLIHSNSGLNQPPFWGRLDGKCDCEIFQDCVVFKTTHFSLFAVVSVLPYPSASISIGPNYGGLLTVPELPGFEVNLPPTFGETITVTATVYYDDAPYNIEDNERALASPCIALEPHGTQFNTPAQISLPIPNYNEILNHFPNAKLELWHAPAGMGIESPEPENWKRFQDANISITQHGSTHVLIFTTTHFSWWESLWDIGKRALQKIGLGTNIGSSRTRYVSIRIQAFMSPPIRAGGVQTFGLLIAVYKFGTPLSHLSNYPWSLLDTGSKRIYLQLGPLEVNIQGCFSALEYEDPNCPLSRATELIEFNGDDFCQRFEFALQLKAGCEAQEGMLMGKLHFKQWRGTTPVHQNYNLIVKHGAAETGLSSQSSPPSQITPLLSRQPPILFNNPDFTPPWSPESDTHIMEIDSEDPFLCQPSTSAMPTPLIINPQDTDPLPPPRKRQLNQAFSHPTYESSSPRRPKRRRLFRTGDINDQTLLAIAEDVGSKYTELGIKLGLDYSWIQSNVENKPSMNKDHLKALHILEEWKSRSGEEFGFAELAKALESDVTGLNRVAVKFCYDTNS